MRIGFGGLIALAACTSNADTVDAPSRGPDARRIDAPIDAALDAAPIDAAIDASPDAAPPPGPRSIALAVKGVRAPLRVYAYANGGFRKVLDLADPLGYGQLAWTDYDGDGRADLVTTFGVPMSPGANELLVVHDDGATGLSTAGSLSWNPSTLAGYDADGDGYGDVYAGLDGGGDALFQSDGTQLARTWLENGNSKSEDAIAVGDMTGDGQPELALARDFWGRAIDGSGAMPASIFSYDMDDGTVSLDVRMADVDGDGLADAIFLDDDITGAAGSLTAYHWNGTAIEQLWTTAALGPLSSEAWADLDGDGSADLAACSYDAKLRIYYRVGTTFTPDAATNAQDLPCNRLVFGDFDADGAPDLAVTDGGVTIYHNVGGAFTQVFHDDTTVDSLAWGPCDPGLAECFASAPSL
ncbi:MAG TPA: VCBS repeat-containing protein [Kofleriaceae bacterium]|jgi:hypothetical protein